MEVQRISISKNEKQINLGNNICMLAICCCRYALLEGGLQTERLLQRGGTNVYLKK